MNVDTGDEKTSYLTRVGINQVRVVVNQIHHVIHRYMSTLQSGTRVLPIRIINGPELASAESCFHVRSLLLSVDYNVTEQVTDIGIEFNYFQRGRTILNSSKTIDKLFLSKAQH